MNKIFLIAIALIFCGTISCGRVESVEVYHPFQHHTWQRFDILKFEIPIKPSKSGIDLILFTRLNPGFAQDTLGFNVIINTPAGEERIGEFLIDIKSKDGVSGGCKGDSCEYTIELVRETIITQGGILHIEVENLTPRMQTYGVKGVGIRLTESRK